MIAEERGASEGPSSWELIGRIRRGDREAGDLLCRRYGPRLVHLVRRLLRSRPRKKLDTDDLVQSSLREIFEHLDSFEYRGEGAFLAWMTSIVESKLRGSLRYWSSAGRAPEREEAWDVGELPSAGPSPSQEAGRREEVEDLYRAIDQLPDRQRRVVIRRMILALPWDVVARADGVTVPAAQMALSRAKKALAVALKKPADR